MTTAAGADAKPGERSFRIRGMDCAEEVAALKAELAPVVGGEAHLAFDLLEGKLIVRDAASVSTATIEAAVARTGLAAEAWGAAKAPEAAAAAARRWRVAWTAVSGVFGLAAFATHAIVEGRVASALGSEGAGLAHAVPIAARLLYLVGIAAGTAHVLPRAWIALRRLRPDMNLLMSIAVAGAMGIGEWFEAATVSFLFSLSLAIEGWSLDRARRAVKALMNLAPTTVHVLRGGAESEVEPGAVAVGERFSVRPGERVPLDGTVLRGTSDVDQAPITGESVPAPKAPGSPVFAGTVNGDGALEVECMKVASDTTLAHIVRMVGDAQARRAPSEQWVESFARYYTPAVLLAAVAMLAVPPILLGHALADGVYRALVLLVIGCPCALVISTPVTIVSALAAAARNGVLVKGGLHLEVAGRLVAVAVDKTGTLTEGRPRVVEVAPLGELPERTVLELATAIELRSEHPLARAIVLYANAKGVAPAPADDVKTVQGKGVTATVSGKRLWLGSHRYLEERGQETPTVHERLAALSGAGRSVVVLGDETRALGLIALADTVRAEAPAAIGALRAAGIVHVALLTGDNRGTAESVGRAVGVDEVRAELLPADKVAAIESLVARFGAVAMIGDGVNDAPALARATLGIAMGAAGTDAAIETADVALMSDDLAKLPWLIQHSRRTLAIVRQNIAASLVVKAIFVALTLLGKASLWAAIAADMGVSFAVIANALRLLRDSGLSRSGPPTPAVPRTPWIP